MQLEYTDVIGREESLDGSAFGDAGLPVGPGFGSPDSGEQSTTPLGASSGEELLMQPPAREATNPLFGSDTDLMRTEDSLQEHANPMFASHTEAVAPVSAPVYAGNVYQAEQPTSSRFSSSGAGSRPSTPEL